MATIRIREAASLLGVSTDTMRRWAEDGRVATVSDASRRLAVDGVALAKLAQELAEQHDHGAVSVEIPDRRPPRPSAPIREARRAG